jgi:hypothetical protein
MFIVSRNPFFEQFELILNDLYKTMKGEGLRAPLEDYLTPLLYEIPAPPRGIQKVKLSLLNQMGAFTKVHFFYPPINKLPFVDDECINVLFEALNVDHVLLFFKRVLLDSNVRRR